MSGEYLRVAAWKWSKHPDGSVFPESASWPAATAHVKRV